MFKWGRDIKIVALLLLALATGLNNYAQCTMLPASTICGDINPGITVITPSPACFKSTVLMHLTSDIPVDSICITFGDGQDTLILNPDTAFNITHNYNFPPPDDCPGGDPYPGIQCIIQANFYKHCAGNGFSFNFKSTSISFRFKPRVKFPYHDAVLCSGSCINLPLDTSCTNTYWQTDSTSYTWTYGDTSQPFTVLNTPFSYYLSPTHCYSAPGTYVMVLTAVNECGTEADSLKLTIQRIDTLIIPQITHLCTGNPVDVHIIAENGTNLNTFISPGPPDDTVLGPQSSNPELIFRTPGTYTVFFSSGACFVDTTIVVQSGTTMTHIRIPDTCYTGVNQIILDSFYSTPSDLQTNDFTISDTAGVLFYYIGTGVPSTPVNLPHAGKYFVMDTSFSTCDTLVVVTDTFNLLPHMVFNLPPDTSVCLQSVYLLPVFAGTTISLDGIILTSDTAYIDSVKDYNFVYTPVCGNSVTFKVTGKGTPAQGLDSSFCASPGLINLTGSPAGGTFSGMYVANGQMDGNAAGPGIHPYTYSYTDVVQGCTYVDTGYIKIYPAMVVSFTLSDAVCAGTAAGFVNNDTSQVSKLNFGDGTGLFTSDSISHIYNTSGLQNVLVQITDTLGCSVNIADSVRVLPLPVANFTVPAAVCDSTIVIPVLTDTLVPQNIYNWVYNGDTTLTPPAILMRDTLYNIVNYIVNLTVTSPQCGSISQSDSISALPQTKSLFGLIYQANCSPMHVAFANNSRGDSLTYTWYLNGNLLSNDSLPAATLLTADSVDSGYRFKLVICSASCGCDSFTDSVTVHPVNFAVCFLPDSFTVCQGEKVNFTDCGRNYCTLIYNFGDGQDTLAQSGETVGHTYIQPGTYTVWLTMSCNCMTDSASQQVVIKPRPLVTPVITNSQCTGHLADFNANAILGNPVFYMWDFGDSTYSTLQNATHTYTNAGVYYGWLYAIGNDFCASDTQFFTLPVTLSPSASFFVDTAVCQRTLLQIKVDTVADNTTYVWHVVLGNDSQLVTSSVGQINFNTADTGTYTLWLNAMNNGDLTCSNVSGNMQVTVLPAPIAKFTVNPAEADVSAPFYFFNQSTSALSYWWTFGDGDSVYDVNPVHRYITAGLYNITLVAYNNFCKDTTTGKVLADPVLNIFIPNTIIANGTGYNNFFQIYGDLEAIQNLSVEIFDRAGEMVFSSNDIQFKWDGTFKGKPVGPAVFVYEIKLNVVGEEKMAPRVYKGSVTVLR
jgi:gliding motility-associated-like protein